VAQLLACVFPCRRFTDILADAGARLRANVDRYSFIAVDSPGAPVAFPKISRSIFTHAKSARSRLISICSALTALP